MTVPSSTGQSGKTSSQMLRAPLNCFYVWPTAILDYPTALLAHLNRKDILPVSFSSDPDRIVRGTTRQVVLDHGCFEYPYFTQQRERLNHWIEHRERQKIYV